MKISTSFLFDRATERMSTIQNKLATTQAQLAVGKQILSPSIWPCRDIMKELYLLLTV